MENRTLAVATWGGIPGTIFVKTLTHAFTVTVCCTDTVLSVKDWLHYAKASHGISKRLLFAGQQMDDWRTLADYHVQKDSALQLQRLEQSRSKALESVKEEQGGPSLEGSDSDSEFDL